MKFFEFGQENQKTLLLLCGWSVNWQGAMPTVEALKKQYHVIVEAYDGFNIDEPQTTFKSVVNEVINSLTGFLTMSVMAVLHSRRSV